MVIATGKTNILERVRSHSAHPWLLDHHGDPLTPHFADTFEHYFQQLQQSPKDTRLMIADSNPAHFLAKFLAACAAQRTVFLGNAKWVQSEWAQAWAIAHPTHSWLTPPRPAPLAPLAPRPLAPQLPPNAILIPTGGTSGSLRFAIHTWDTLTASATGFCQHFQVDTVNTCCVLPLYHVSGLMQFMRSFLSGGKIVLSPFKHLEQSKSLDIDSFNFFLSLVPTQLARLCHTPHHLQLLQSFKAILLGGAPPWPDLLEMGRRYHLPLAPTYGMTETASQVATLRPTEFLQTRAIPTTSTPSGSRSLDNNAGSVLPHATITIREQSGRVLGPNQVGIITIQSPSLAWGYCSEAGTAWIGATEQPLNLSQRRFQSNDLGFLDDVGQLHVVGRQRDMIISGGENIAPTEVESAIRLTGLVDDVAVVGVSDRLWGEAVTAIYVPARKPEQTEDVGEDAIASIKAVLAEQLNRIKHPKYWIAVSSLPCNAQGKVNRSKLRAIAHAHLKS